MSSTPTILVYLEQMNQAKASDLYLTVGFPPAMRVENRMQNLSDVVLTVDDINEILTSILTNRQRHDFDMHMELNTSLDIGKYGRFRVNVLRQRQCPALVIRRIISRIPNFEELKLPPIIERIAMERRGLVLVTGMTGSGKSTTLASMVDFRNEREQGHVITIEDPIEYHHEHKKCIVTQREVGVDTVSYTMALKNALRQRPDVVLVGEIRDSEVMDQALTAAETGHLTLATLHTSNAYQSIERAVNIFKEEYHNQVRLSLATNLKAIVSQRLIPDLSGGVTLAVEVLLNQGLVKELIQKGDIHKIKDVMAQNRQVGMCTFDQSLLDLYARGLISADTAISHSDMSSDMKMKIQNQDLSGGEEDEGLSTMDTSLLQISD